MGPNDVLDHGQADAGPLTLDARAADPRTNFLKISFLLFAGNARTFIANADGDCFPSRARSTQIPAARAST